MPSQDVVVALEAEAKAAADAKAAEKTAAAAKKLAYRWVGMQRGHLPCR